MGVIQRPLCLKSHKTPTHVRSTPPPCTYECPNGTSRLAGRPVRVADDSSHRYRRLSFLEDTGDPWGSYRGPGTLTPTKHPHEKAAHPHNMHMRVPEWHATAQHSRLAAVAGPWCKPHAGRAPDETTIRPPRAVCPVGCPLHLAAMPAPPC